MREVIVVEREIVTENERTILRERKVRSLLCDDGAVRLLSYGGKRIVSPQERSDHAKSA